MTKQNLERKIITPSKQMVVPIGLGSEDELILEARERNLLIFSASQAADLIAFAFQDGREPRKIREYLDWGLVLNTACHYYSNGVYFEDFPKFDFSGVLISKSEDQLKRRIKEGDSRVRFAQYRYKTGDLEQEEFTENPFAIGLFNGRTKTKMLAREVEPYTSKILLRGDQRDATQSSVRSVLAYISYTLGYSADRLVIEADNQVNRICNHFAFAFKKRE